MAQVDLFIEKFHNLEGYLLKEKKKSLFLLLDSNKHLQEQEVTLRDINSKLKPKTYLEEIYKLEFLLYFRRSSELLLLLQEGNDVAANKIIRQRWFLESVFKNIKPLEFLKTVFDRLSIIVREKILNRIIRQISDENVINELFDYLLDTYGLKPALTLLPGCSVEKIKKILEERQLKLSHWRLKLLHDKDSALISFYYEEYFKSGGNLNDLQDIAKYLAKVNPDLFVNLRLKYKCYGPTLGRRTTKKYVLKRKEKILEDPMKFVSLDLFEESALVRRFGKDFPKLFKSIFPKEPNKLLDACLHFNRLLHHYPKKKRYELYLNTFEETFKRKLLSNKAFITPGLLEVIPNSEEREKWVEKFENDVKYLKYKRSSLAVAELKEHLHKCDGIQLREQICKDIVLSCSINHDYNSLLDILKLFTGKLRNTEETTFEILLETIKKKIKLNELNSEHWQYIYEIILIQEARRSRANRVIVFECCRFLYKTDKSFEELILIIIKSYFSYNTFEFRKENFNDPNFEKQFIKLILKHLPKVKIDESVEKNNTIEILKGIKRWNRLYPEDKILVSEEKKIVEVIKKSVDSTWVYFSNDEVAAMKYLVCCENLSQEFADIYFNHIGCLENATMTRWFMKYKPGVFEKKLDDLVGIINGKTRTYVPKTDYILKFFRKYKHTGLTDKIVDHYLEKIKDPNEDDKVKITTLLAYVMQKELYLKVLEEYVPTVDKLNLVNAGDEEKNLLQIQTALARTISLTNCHVDALPIILRYTNSDCFQNTLHSIYSCFYHVPENSLRDTAQKLLENRVSVRKHAIFLAAMAFPMELNYGISQKIISNDDNQSIKKHLFLSSYKFFLKNPLDQIWKILKEHISSLTVQDIECLKILTNVRHVPKIYKNQFLEEADGVFELLEAEKPMSTYYDDMMEKLVDDDMKVLSHELCVKIISSKLFTHENKTNDHCVNFSIKFMLYSRDIRCSVQSIISILENYKTQYSNTDTLIHVKSLYYNMCKKLFEKVMNRRQLRVHLPKEFANIFSEEWKKVFTKQETFEEYLMIDFMVIKYEDSKDLSVYASRAYDVIVEARDIYGDMIVGLITQFFTSSLRSLLGEEKYEIKLIKLLENILKKDSSTLFCLLVVNLLPPKQSDKEFLPSFEYILEELKDKPSIVGVYLNKYFKESNHI